MAMRLVKGNAAVVIGALYAGCDCYFGYPITPASEVLQEASEYFPRAGRRFVQAESEVAAINMVYGAASTGRRVMTASSGPGISLKQEGVSYLAGSELPAVIVDVVRAGPGLGNIGPEQGDYFQVVKGGGHGNYRCIVLAPDSVQEMCDLTRKAFDLAQRYRTPVYVLADGVLGQMYEPLQFPEEAVAPVIDESWAVAGTAATRANCISSIMLDFNQMEALNVRLQEKYALIESQEVLFDEYMLEDAGLAIVAYGISARIAHSVVDTARAEGFKVGLLRPKTLFPFPKVRLRELAQRPGMRFISMEMSNGQMIDDIRLAIDCRCPVELVNRMGGNLIAPSAVLDKIRTMCGKER